MNDLTAHSIRSVVEPLCKATETTFRPVSFRDHEFLFIDLDADGSKFVTVVQACRPARSDDPQDEVFDHPTRGRLTVDAYRPVSHSAASGWQKRVPESTQRGFGRYIFATTDFSALVMYHAVPASQVVFKSEEAKTMFRFLITRFMSQSRSAEMIAQFRVQGIVPEMPSDFIDHPELPLTDYQRVALLCSIQQEGRALFMEQGTGKTAVAINRICLEGHRKREGTLPGVKKGMYRALILCPNAVRLNWESEFERFATRPGKTSVLRGGPIHRLKALIDGAKNEEDCDWSACILSIDSVQSMLVPLSKVPWDLVIIDESHYIKNARAKRTKACLEFAYNFAFQCRQRMALTGTPVANVFFDLWAQLEFLGQGLSGFASFSNFRSFHGQYKKTQQGGSSVQKLIGFKAIPLLQERLARLAFMITKDQANLGLPEKTYSLMEVEMTPNQKKLYSTLAEKLVAECEDLLDASESGGKKITADHILTKMLRLSQITSGHVRWDGEDDLESCETTPGKIEQIPGGNPKVDAILEFLNEKADSNPNGKTIIWAHYVEDVRIVSERLTAAGIHHVGYHSNVHADSRQSDAGAAQRYFNSTPDCKVFLGNPASGGTGLNIIGYDPTDPESSSCATDDEIFMSCDWSAVKRSQAEDRAHRRGTRRNVQIRDLVVPGTIDEEIRARVAGKRQTALLIQDIRDILTNIVSNLKK